LVTKVQENGKTNGDVPMDLTEWITEDLANTENDDFVSKDEKVLASRITKDLENTNQDDYVISEGETKKDLPALMKEDLKNTNEDLIKVFLLQ
jgi:hypothetical protein